MKTFKLDNATNEDIVKLFKKTNPHEVKFMIGDVEMFLDAYEMNTQDDERWKFTFKRRYETGFIISG